MVFRLQTDSREVLAIKAYAAILYDGKLGFEKARDMRFDDLEFTEDGCTIKYVVSQCSQMSSVR